MSVVERCPNCGTTQASAGECEACHEAQVRYFCTNHEPGVWLTGRTCPQCEARAAPTARPTARPTASASALPSHTRPASRGADPVVSGTERERLPPAREETLAPRASRRALWEKLLRGAVLARPPAEAASERELESLGHAGGFLKRLALRLVLIAVVLVAALAVTVYWVARSLP